MSTLRSTLVLLLTGAAREGAPSTSPGREWSCSPMVACRRVSCWHQCSWQGIGLSRPADRDALSGASREQPGRMRPTAYRRNARGRRDREALEGVRLQAAELFTAGHTQAQVARALGVSRQHVSRWHDRWQRGGPEALRTRGSPGPAPRLADQQLTDLRAALRQSPRRPRLRRRQQPVDPEPVRCANRPADQHRLPPRACGGWRAAGCAPACNSLPGRRARSGSDRVLGGARLASHSTKTPADDTPGSCSEMSRASPCCRRPTGPGRRSGRPR